MSDPLRELIALRELPRRRIIGLMSGTSADGIDAALIEVEGHGPASRVELLAFDTVDLPRPIRERIWRLPDDLSVNLCELNFMLGRAFADAAEHICQRARLARGEVQLIGSHGQTARHQPPSAAEPRGSTLQIGEGAVIAERLGLPVICDFRVADVAAGGQGAPLIPLVDYLLFRQPGETVALLNLGGIANVSLVGQALDELLAFDTGPANMTLDAVARAASGGESPYDQGGAIADAGAVDAALLEELLAHPYFALDPPKSTGREAFGRDFAYPLIDRYSGRLDDLMATLAQLTAETVGLAIDRFAGATPPLRRVLVAGGGVHNASLMRRIAARVAPITVASLASLGFDPDAKEAAGFAVLANETLFCRPGNIPNATGARGRRILGKLVLPPPV